MDRDTLIQPEIQERIRAAINKAMIEENLTLDYMSSTSGVSKTMIYYFLNLKRPVGWQTIRKLTHFVLRYGYKLEELTRIN